MLPKPDACKGCPFFGDGQGFVPDTINDQAEVFIYAQNPGKDEEHGEHFDGETYHPTTPQPLIGRTGHMMDKSFLPVAGLTRDQVSVGNAIRCRYKHYNDLPPLDHVIMRDALWHCHTKHFKLPAKTRLVVVQGEYALYALTQQGNEKHRKISDWRGYVLPLEPLTEPRSLSSSIYHPGDAGSIPVLASYHLAYLFRDPTAGLITKWDWRKIPRILKGTWPRRVPTIQDGPPQTWPARSAFDTEFVPETNKFLCYSLAYPSAKGDGSLVLRVSEQLEPGAVLGKSLVVMQNATADLPFLEKMLKEFTYDDIMHAHAVLWSDFPHDLGFLGSLYSSLNRWKHLVDLNPKLYSAGDAYATWEIYEELEKEFDRDAASRNVYRNIQLKLIPIIRAAEAKGVAVNPATAKTAFEKRQAVLDELALRAQAIVGWPINLRSNDQVKHQLYELEGLLKLV
jgi:uracil-DNA glycosylase